MTIYIDVVIFLNIFFDFILLLATSLLLKRNVKIYKILLGSIIGSLTTFILFLDISNVILFIIKIIVSILMCITTFNYKNIKYTFNNIIYLYIISIFLGGFLYLVNNSLDYHNGLVFYSNGLSINIILIIILTPILLLIYLKKLNNLKTNYHNYYKIKIYINNTIIESTSYLDTGNKLRNPYNLNSVILLHNKSPVFKNMKYTLIPYNTVNSNGFIKGYKVDKVYIEGIGNKYKVTIAIIDSNINIDGVDSIISTSLLEGK